MATHPRTPRRPTPWQLPAPVSASTAAPIANWVASAACADADPEAFAAATPEAEAEAKATCARCQVRPQCRDYALATAQEWGVWGGLSEAERAALLDAEKHGSATAPLQGAPL